MKKERKIQWKKDTRLAKAESEFIRINPDLTDHPTSNTVGIDLEIRFPRKLKKKTS